jgi:hypothetical protein
MTAVTKSTGPAAVPASTRSRLIGLLRALLLTEAVLALVLTILLSLLAGGIDANRGGDGASAIRFAAGGTFIVAIAAAIASRGARRRRSWAWTLAAILQLIVAIATGAAVLLIEWHPAYLVGFALATAVMAVLSTAGVRRALGQE